MGGVHSGRSRRRKYFSEARFLPQRVEERLGQHDPVLHGSFGGASLELAQGILVLAKAGMDEGEIERIDIATIPPDHFEAAEDPLGIVKRTGGAEDRARIATPDRVPRSRFECSMHQVGGLFGSAEEHVVAGQPERRPRKPGPMVNHELQLLGRLLELAALVLDPTDGELRADTGLKVQPLVR